jgi:hypothetical protein
MKLNYLYNPFTYFAGVKALLTGLVGLIIISAVAYTTGTHQNGLLYVSFASDTIWPYYFLDHCTSWLSIAVLLYVSGLLFSKSNIRPIDVLGSTLVSRIPLVFLPLIRLIPAFRSFQAWGSINLYLLIIIHIAAVIWCIALLYNAYKVSCNVKGNKLTISFIASLLLAEISTHFALHIIYSKPFP